MGRVAEIMGAPLFPGQQYVFDVALEVLPDGSFAYDEILDSEPRRSGKSHKARALVGWRCGREKSTAWLTAQDRGSAVNRWREVADDLVAVFGSRVRRKISHSFEEVRWASTGSVFRPFAPNDSGMHGEDPDLVLVDEFWTVAADEKAELENSYEPAFSIKTQAQAWKLSAAGTSKSVALRDDRARGRECVNAGLTQGMALFDWGIPEFVDGLPVAELPDDRLIRLVLANHPRAGRGLRESFLWSQLAKSRATFLRSYGNIDQEDDPGDLAIGVEAWQGSRSPVEIPAGVRVGAGVEVDPSGRESSVAVAWRGLDGRALVQVVQHGPGVRWVADYVSGLGDVAVVAGFYVGRCRAVMDEFSSGVEVLKLYRPEMAAASARFFDGVTAPRPDVLHDGSVALERGLRAAELLPGRPWQPRGGGEAFTAVLACSAALWAADHMPAEKAPVAAFKIY